MQGQFDEETIKTAGFAPLDVISLKFEECTIENRGEMLFPFVNLHIIVDIKPIVEVLYTDNRND